MPALSNLRFSCRLVSTACVLAVALGAPAIATAQCPTNTVYCIGESCCEGEELFNSTESSAGPTHSVSVNASSASYDLTDGSLYAMAYVDDVYLHRSGAIAADEFELQGIPAAVLTVRLHLSYYCVTDPSGRIAWAEGYARLTGGGQTVDATSLGPGIAPFVELEVAAAEGEPFTVVYETRAKAWGFYPVASMTCQLEFVDVPAGGRVTSCNGFGSPPVPVEQTTWGAVKSLYR